MNTFAEQLERMRKRDKYYEKKAEVLVEAALLLLDEAWDLVEKSDTNLDRQAFSDTCNDICFSFRGVYNK